MNLLIRKNATNLTEVTTTFRICILAFNGRKRIDNVERPTRRNDVVTNKKCRNVASSLKST
jgi:hypothetical protein